MNDEVKHFYLENKTPIEKIIAIGMNKMGLSRASLEEALERVYDDIQGGEEIKPIRVAWKVYALAKQLKIADEVRDMKELENLKKELAWYKQPWWKRVFRSYENV